MKLVATPTSPISDRKLKPFRSFDIPDTSQSDWKAELLNSYTSISELLGDQLISEREAEVLTLRKLPYQFRLTRYYASLMTSHPQCPIRAQAIPSQENDPLLPDWAQSWSQEIYSRPVPWHQDAIGDQVHLGAPRITHRYGNRAILHVSSMCAVFCRFCFRKVHLNDHEKSLYGGSLEPALNYLRSKPEIRELILTGGDPLSLNDAAIQGLLERISEIQTVRIVRIHSRMSVTLPSRFTHTLIDLLSRDWGFQLYLSSHYNHLQELTDPSKAVLKALRRRGVTLLNQSVLLRGVNDSVEQLGGLFQSLYEEGVLPFYLHHPDWTPGTFHFRSSIERGIQIMTGLKGRVTGPALPDYVLDLPQGFGKISLLGNQLQKVMNIGPEGDLKGAIYEAAPPETRLNSSELPKQSQRYLDLSFA